MLATAATVAKTMGKNAAIKIRNIAGESPIPNHRIAKGIQANGERFRKKFTAGKSATRAFTTCPSRSPIGTPVMTASPKPLETRNMDASRSPSSRPLFNSVQKPFATGSGAGNADSGKIFRRESNAQMPSNNTNTAMGRRMDDLSDDLLSMGIAEPKAVESRNWAVKAVNFNILQDPWFVVRPLGGM